MAKLISHKTLLSTCLMLMLLTNSCKFGASSEKITAFFIFGDSTVDTGNNNYINTTAENSENYKPYGQGFFGEPTGRFSDGRVIVDLIAEYAKLPLIPPFLEASADFTNGANFASGGAGILPETNKGTVIDLPTQLKNYEAVQKTLVEKLGEIRAKELISEAVYFISIGSNDYMGGYLGNPRMQELYLPATYVSMVIGNLTQTIQVLYEKGARKFGFLSLAPLGCLPALRSLNPNEGCLEEGCGLARAHNKALRVVLTSLEYILKGFKYSNSNFYEWLEDRINNPSKYGFKDGVNACCGTGPYGGVYTCGGTKKVKDYRLCDNAEDHVWWDSFHPTEGIYEQCAKELWNGPPSTVGPYNLEELFFNQEKKNTIIADIVDAPEVRIF
ncbi:hypothetical protein SLE2022_038460 [Rubroshorea leprosula]